jgi:hypothetical protein
LCDLFCVEEYNTDLVFVKGFSQHFHKREYYGMSCSLR